MSIRSREGALFISLVQPALVHFGTSVWARADSMMRVRCAACMNGDARPHLSTLNSIVLEEELEQKGKNPALRGNFTLLMVAITSACKSIAHGVNR